MRIITLITATVLAFATLPAAAQEPPRGPVEMYKGVKLVGTALPNRKNTKFFRNAKLAVDMVRKLPKAWWNQTALIKELVYYPPHPDRIAPGITANIIGVYTIGNYSHFPAPIIVYQNMLYSSGLQLALSIVANAMHAANHRKVIRNARLIDDIKKGRRPGSQEDIDKAMREGRYLLALVKKALPKEQLFKADCRNRIAVLEAHKVLHYDANIIGQFNASLQEDGCI
jgi:hypothetical protein